MKAFNISLGIVLLLLLLFLISCASNQQSSTESLDEYLQRSTKAYQSKDYPQYQRLMQKIVDLLPQNYKYRYFLARACALNNDLENAVKIMHFLLDEDYDLAIFAERDTNFDSIRKSEQFQEIINRIKKKTKPLNNSQIVFSIPEKDLIPEGITYDPVDETFYLGSVEKCKIIRINKQGKIVNIKINPRGLTP